jgi:DnaJ-class molecular chaperone
MLQQKNHYEILGLQTEAKADEIKLAAQSLLAQAKKEHEAQVENYKKAYSMLLQKNTDAKARTKALSALGLSGKVDMETVKSAAQDALKKSKLDYERRNNEIKSAFAVLGNAEKREEYNNQLLLQKERSERREKSSKQAKLAKARVERQKSAFLPKLLRWILLILLILVGVKLYFDNQELIHQWLFML